MYFDEIDGELMLSSGKRLYCNLETISLNSKNELVYGSDGYMEADDLTAQERSEIARYCIAKWKKWGGIK
jgi:hypothetical protein